MSASATCRESGATEGAAVPLKAAVASCAGAAGADARTTTEGVLDDDDEEEEGADVDAGEARRRADIRPARMDAIGRVTSERGASGESAGEGSARGDGIEFLAAW